MQYSFVTRARYNVCTKNSHKFSKNPYQNGVRPYPLKTHQSPYRIWVIRIMWHVWSNNFSITSVGRFNLQPFCMSEYISVIMQQRFSFNKGSINKYPDKYNPPLDRDPYYQI